MVKKAENPEKEKNVEYTRQFYRVEYPEGVRPFLDTGRERFEAVNISEKGGRFRPVEGDPPAPGATVAGSVTFHEGKPVEVEGEVLKILEGDAVVCFTRRIHFKVILKEQWFLMRKYRHLVE